MADNMRGHWVWHQLSDGSWCEIMVYDSMPDDTLGDPQVNIWKSETTTPEQNPSESLVDEQYTII